MYVGILLVHVLCVFFYWMNKGLFHLFLYLPLVGMWLFLAVPSGFVQSWSWTWTNGKLRQPLVMPFLWAHSSCLILCPGRASLGSHVPARRTRLSRLSPSRGILFPERRQSLMSQSASQRIRPSCPGGVRRERHFSLSPLSPQPIRRPALA